MDLPGSDHFSDSEKLRLTQEAIKALNSEEFENKLEQTLFPLLKQQLVKAKQVHTIIKHQIKETQQKTKWKQDKSQMQNLLTSQEDKLEPSPAKGEDSRIEIEKQNKYYSQVIMDSKNILFRLCDVIHLQTSNLLKLRFEQNSKLGLNDFVRMYGHFVKFIDFTQNTIKHNSLPLRAAINSQVYFFPHFVSCMTVR